ncbi:MAG: hypothetical protein AAF957_25550 [Planctomycetota bacterium]
MSRSTLIVLALAALGAIALLVVSSSGGRGDDRSASRRVDRSTGPWTSVGHGASAGEGSLDVAADLEAPSRASRTPAIDGEVALEPPSGDSDEEPEDDDSSAPHLVLHLERKVEGPYSGPLQLFSASTIGVGLRVSKWIDREDGVLKVRLDPRGSRRLARGAWFELTNRERTATTGVFFAGPETREIFGLQLLPVGQVVFTFDRDDAKAFVEFFSADAIVAPSASVRYEARDGNGRPVPAFVDMYATRDRSAEFFALDRCTGESVEVLFRFPGYERVNANVPVVLGERSEHRVVLRRRANRSRLSGRVTTASGQPLDAGGMRGRVRIVDASDRTQQFNVDLTWDGGVARWESKPLPPGSYRLWIDDSGVVTSSPAEEVVLAPPASGIDWVLQDDGERRTVAVRVVAGESGEPLRDGIEVATLWSPTRRHVDQHYGQRLRSGVPLGSAIRFVVLAPDREPIELGMGDFGERGWVHRDGAEWAGDGEPSSDEVERAFFASVAPRLLEDLEQDERAAAEERLRALGAR